MPRCEFCHDNSFGMYRVKGRWLCEPCAVDAGWQTPEQQLAARDAEIARLADVIRELRAQAREVEFCDIAMLEGFAWTAETAAFVRQEFDKETERLIGGAK